MYRKVTRYFEKWQKDPYRKPLVVFGARQVGKTYAILEFGKNHYDNVAYFNFQTNDKIAETFSENISPEYLIKALSYISGQTILKEHTLIVFDEIQLCERALTSLKYFCEEAREYHIIAAGSLLGIAVNREKYAFPVGKIDRLIMRPMDMEEYLLAAKKEDLIDSIKDCYANDKKMPTALHVAAISLYRQYLSIGGMPEVVARYVETKDYTQARHVQESIQYDYLDDMSKYQESTSEIKKTKLTYKTVATQLSKKNTRFQYKVLKTGARASEYENAISRLLLGNMISQVYRVEQIEKPLDNYKDKDDFKIYLSDMGLLCAQKDIHENDIMYMEKEPTDFKCGMIENYVNSQLISNGFNTFFWRDDRGTNEVDFVINLNNKLVPIEVKSGINVKSDGLKEYTKRYKPDYSIRLSERNFEFENGIKSVPLYATFCIK